MHEKLTNYFNWHSEHFFPFYLSEHQNPKGRAMHYSATATGIAGFTGAAATGSLWLIAAGITAGYLQAWTAHEKFEHNIPATFKVPLGSLISDYMMSALWLTGRLENKMKGLGLDPTGENPKLSELIMLDDYIAMKNDASHKPQTLKAQRGQTILSSLKNKF